MNANVGCYVLGVVLGGLTGWCFGREYQRRRNLDAAIRHAEEKGAAIVDDLKATVASK